MEDINHKKVKKLYDLLSDCNGDEIGTAFAMLNPDNLSYIIYVANEVLNGIEEE